MKNAECRMQPMAILRPPSSQVQASYKPRASQELGRCSLVLLLFSSWSARLVPTESPEHPGGSTERPSVFDGLGLAGIHNGVS